MYAQSSRFVLPSRKTHLRQFYLSELPEKLTRSAEVLLWNASPFIAEVIA
jgi:hypothetical protein